MIYLPIVFKIIIILRLIAVLVVYFEVIKLLILQKKKAGSKLFIFFRSMWFLPYLTRFVFFPVLIAGTMILKFVDQGWTEQIGGRAIGRALNKSSRIFSLFNFIGLKFYLLRFLFSLLMF